MKFAYRLPRNNKIFLSGKVGKKYLVKRNGISDVNGVNQDIKMVLALRVKNPERTGGAISSQAG